MKRKKTNKQTDLQLGTLKEGQEDLKNSEVGPKQSILRRPAQILNP